MKLNALKLFAVAALMALPFLHSIALAAIAISDGDSQKMRGLSHRIQAMNGSQLARLIEPSLSGLAWAQTSGKDDSVHSFIAQDQNGNQYQIWQSMVVGRTCTGYFGACYSSTEDIEALVTLNSVIQGQHRRQFIEIKVGQISNVSERKDPYKTPPNPLAPSMFRKKN